MCKKGHLRNVKGRRGILGELPEGTSQLAWSKVQDKQLPGFDEPTECGGYSNTLERTDLERMGRAEPAAVSL